ncbi:MAG: DegT/DnrJ/EryC1/StrS family aminotransferase [bacterium]
MSASIRIPFYKRTWTDSEIEAVASCIRSGHLTQGALVERFEDEFKDFVGTKHAIAVNSCTSALFLCLKLLGPKKVSIPSMTFVSVASSVIHAGGEIAWLDESWSGSRYALASNSPKQGIIYDSAHALHRGDAPQKANDLACYSFYPTKNLSGAEGGMIATNNKDYAEWLKKARWHARVGKEWDYIIEFPAWKMNMTNIQAAIGLEYFKRIDEEAKKRKLLVDLYNKTLGTSVRSDHIFQTVVDKRDDFVRFMGDNGIECSMHFKPVHKQPAFKQYYKKLPNTEHFERFAVSLPLYPSMNEIEVEEVCGFVKEWGKKHPLPRQEYAEFKNFLKA